VATSKYTSIRNKIFTSPYKFSKENYYMVLERISESNLLKKVVLFMKELFRTISIMDGESQKIIRGSG
jgi:hypothetical protein